MSRAPATLLAGNVAVSLGPDGAPMATLTHPAGGSCQVSLPGVRVTTWKGADGVERLAGGPDGGLLSHGLEGIIASTDWTIESLVGGGGDGDSLAFSAFAEARSADGVPVRSRAEVRLWAGRLALSLEVAHAGGEEMEWEEEEDPAGVADERRAKRSRILPLPLPDVGLQGSLCCNEAAGSVGGVGGYQDGTKDAFDKTGVRLETMGFSVVKSASSGSVMQFKTLAPTEIALQPGETVSGSLQLTLC
ncbi:hypothetical protein AK812_SmicGene30019 [Symbiodinium microadriaticum]|uniref:Uncharacterized protein n=1 Tax=Symbiodinium microadriaticum TaxID=2951 RepID=A0A1Q9D0D9_SYMMI|nr:hypothetical protein AK812_SmicGene30019 [Symbiodinium microadriaticum]CAE7911383.1 unnamed protein product [Symbiodinium sp. KB8]